MIEPLSRHTSTETLPRDPAPGCVGGSGEPSVRGATIVVNNRVDLALNRHAGTYLAAQMVGVLDGSGNMVGSRIRVVRRSTADDATFEIVATPAAVGRWQFNPQVAVNSQGHVAVNFSETEFDSTFVVQRAFGSRSDGDPGTWTNPVQLSAAGVSVADRLFGDYDAITAIESVKFAPRFPNPTRAMPPAPPQSTGHQFRGWLGEFYGAWTDGSQTAHAAGFTP